MTVSPGNINMFRPSSINFKGGKEPANIPITANHNSLNNKQPVQNHLNISFSASKSMKKLRQMIKEDKKKQQQEKQRQIEKQQEKKRILKPLSVELANKLGLSSNPFKESFSEGKKLGIAIAYNLRNDPTETIVIVNKNAEVVAKSGGCESCTGVFYNENKFRNCISIHNHPTDISFSDQDIYSMLNLNLHESIVGTPEGYYSMIIPEDVDKDLAQKTIKTVRPRYESCRKEQDLLLKQGKITKEERDEEFHNYIHSLWKETAKNMGWEYTFTRWD